MEFVVGVEEGGGFGGDLAAGAEEGGGGEPFPEEAPVRGEDEGVRGDESGHVDFDAEFGGEGEEGEGHLFLLEGEVGGGDG